MTFKEEGILILDWDDTLLCTTYITNNNLHNVSDNVLEYYHQTQMMNCCDKIIELLELAQHEKLSTYIVTNATSKWIYFSISKFYPQLISSNIFLQVHIISARDRYETIYPTHVIGWKYFTIRDILAKTRMNNGFCINNVISLGDSQFEHDAVRSLRNEPLYSNAQLKTIKFINFPSEIDHLYEQLNYVVDNLSYIAQKSNNIDIKLNINIIYGQIMIGEIDMLTYTTYSNPTLEALRLSHMLSEENTIIDTLTNDDEPLIFTSDNNDICDFVTINSHISDHEFCNVNDRDNIGGNNTEYDPLFKTNKIVDVNSNDKFISNKIVSYDVPYNIINISACIFAGIIIGIFYIILCK
jgi:hypothetical protein